MTNKRYKFFPCMENYDKMAAGTFAPYAMLSGPIDYHDSVINTDVSGFRWTKGRTEIFKVEDIEKYEHVNILIGGSTVFGVGASSDSQTISSYLAKETGQVWLNFGLRGGVSIQEYIHLIRFIYKAKKVNNIVFLSGNNDLYINLVSEFNDGFDRRFGEIDALDAVYSCKRRIIVGLIAKITGTDKKYLFEKSISDILLSLFKKSINEEKSLTFDDKMNNLVQNYNRNFFLYSALKKQLECNVSFVLQPFFNWTQKKTSTEEFEVFDELERIQKGTAWSVYKDKMDLSLYKFYSSQLRMMGEKNDLRFVDANEDFNENRTLFVDAVHLNDDGNQLMSKIILAKAITT
ncbi:hypothetical protein CYQ88_00840 [Hydrogenovibrio sp. SC-1]|uniref:hypothetical protein n=1 Tax=Hydrogenovibrio sp. SC-1 TaxID=2065820 RepID=UPI000C7C815B|nr:hypothetical protein [Hydrogenovibrio sp. SC-1]PLA75544.1 hypothetical protein CYQ88_00840 [Hydrogenovibrio sp. SC-1]